MTAVLELEVFDVLKLPAKSAFNRLEIEMYAVILDIAYTHDDVTMLNVLVQDRPGVEGQFKSFYMKEHELVEVVGRVSTLDW